MSMFGLMSVKKHEEMMFHAELAITRNDEHMNWQARRIYTLKREIASLRPDAEKHRASVARLAKANAKRKADALAKKAGA